MFAIRHGVHTTTVHFCFRGPFVLMQPVLMKVQSNEGFAHSILFCILQRKIIGIRVVDMQTACAACWSLAKFVAIHVVYSPSMSSYAACPRCV